MMTLAEVRDWLKTQVECLNWYIGKMDGKPEKSITLYNLNSGTPVLAIGGLANTSYAVKAVSILIHWTKNADTAERKAMEVYAALFGQSAVIAGKRVISFQMRTSEPVSVGTDENNIYEYVIEVTIYYER
ncbi:minor capsid protein [Paenibacillus sp. FSL L8-0708]|uniref:minor capsid protein n=1 Tax=Paenibacillus sp. FSL L8-0708 TaxID=2975311 RepID=UPI0030F5AB7D